MVKILQNPNTVMRWLLLSFYALLIGSLSCHGNDQHGNQAIAIVDSEVENKDSTATSHDKLNQIDYDDLNVFQPTSEWQTVYEGQAIPAGLHVRMNLATGKKEAKLMEDGTNKEKEKTTGPNFQNGIPYTKKELKQLLQNMPKDNKAGETFVISDEDRERVKTSYKSIEEIKDDLGKLHASIKTDAQVLQSNIDTLKDKSTNKDDRMTALESIEYLVHQIDNAKDFHTMKGYQLILHDLNGTDVNIKSIAFQIIGAAVQSNLDVQRIMLDLGILPIIFNGIDAKEEFIIRRRSLYALSSLLRNFPPAQMEFLRRGGMTVLTKIFLEGGTEVLRIKALTLISDLLKENHTNYQAEDNISITGRILDELIERKWCKFMPILLQTTDYDATERVLVAMNTVVAYCKEEFDKDNVSTKLKNSVEKWKKLIAEDDDNSFYSELIDLSVRLQNKLSIS
ncbi:Nucleotide exchange factor SIL1 [Trichoplax sp. H2]|nr:Nucleotide exchange factor SIL1 [Trichoplax sp. H2]|eukprot:RDD45551.1 Nucleotide exchange factor SIL1 [Trichoplax sp. H2]